MVNEPNSQATVDMVTKATAILVEAVIRGQETLNVVADHRARMDAVEAEMKDRRDLVERVHAAGHAIGCRKGFRWGYWLGVLCGAAVGACAAMALQALVRAGTP